MKIKSPAKLNLHLEVLKKRKDGFHELRTVFQLIDFYDEIAPNFQEHFLLQKYLHISLLKKVKKKYLLLKI